MKLRIRKVSVGALALYMFFFMVFVFDYQIFYLSPLPSWLEFLKNNQMNLTVGLVSILCAVYYFEKYRKRNIGLYNRLFLYAGICLLTWIVLIIYSVFMYPNQPLRLTVGFHATFLYIFLSIPCITLFLLEGDRNTIFTIMNIVACVWYLLLIYQHIVYNNSSQIVFNFQELLSSTTRALEREHGIRISLKSLGNIMILYNFDNFFNKKTMGKWRLCSLAAFVMGMYCLIMVQQTRAMIFVVLCALAVIAVFGAKNLNKKVIVFAVGIVLIAILFYSGVITDFLHSFSLQESNAERLGTSIRLRALVYYMQCFLSRPFLGNGFTSDYYYPEIQHGSSGECFYSDVGIIGLFGEVGLTALIFYIYPLWRVIKTSRLAYKKRLQTEYSFLIGLAVYLIVSSATLIITATNMMVAFPVIIAYAEYSYEKLKSS